MHVNNFMYRELGRNGHLVEKTQRNIQPRIEAAPCFIVPKPKNEMFKRGLHFFGYGSME